MSRLHIYLPNVESPMIEQRRLTLLKLLVRIISYEYHNLNIPLEISRRKFHNQIQIQKNWSTFSVCCFTFTLYTTHSDSKLVGSNKDKVEIGG